MVLLLEEASMVFRSSFSTNFPDPNHSIGDERFILIGVSSLNRLLVVAHTERANQIRIISAREVNRQEQRFYEEGT